MFMHSMLKSSPRRKFGSVSNTFTCNNKLPNLSIIWKKKTDVEDIDTSSQLSEFLAINKLVSIPPWGKEVEERAGHSYKQCRPHHDQPY
jgi:hypothetical protein